jgi:hypothetical protein
MNDTAYKEKIFTNAIHERLEIVEKFIQQKKDEEFRAKTSLQPLTILGILYALSIFIDIGIALLFKYIG